MASILARRVALEVSDSDEGPSDSEYDSDEWGETLPLSILHPVSTNYRCLCYIFFCEFLTL